MHFARFKNQDGSFYDHAKSYDYFDKFRTRWFKELRLIGIKDFSFRLYTNILYKILSKPEARTSAAVDENVLLNNNKLNLSYAYDRYNKKNKQKKQFL